MQLCLLGLSGSARASCGQVYEDHLRACKDSNPESAVEASVVARNLLKLTKSEKGELDVVEERLLIGKSW